MRKLLVVAAVVAGSMSFGAFGGATADELPTGVEGCVASDPGAKGPTALYPKTCTYTAKRSGGFAGGAQSWQVRIVRPNGQVTTYSGSNQACHTASTVAGDTVTVTVTNGFVAAGNPFPGAADGSIPSSNRC